MVEPRNISYSSLNLFGKSNGIYHSTLLYQKAIPKSFARHRLLLTILNNF